MQKSDERREFQAGMGWYLIWIPMIAVVAGIAFLGLRDNQWKKNFLPGGLFLFIAIIFFFYFLSRVRLWPWYLGPTLIVDNSGLKTQKWTIPWNEIETINTVKVGKAYQIGIVKKGQRPWEMPYLIDGPLGVKIVDVVRYLQVRKASYMQK
jgi:hypothetical protein